MNNLRVVFFGPDGFYDRKKFRFWFDTSEKNLYYFQYGLTEHGKIGQCTGFFGFISRIADFVDGLFPDS